MQIISAKPRHLAATPRRLVFTTLLVAALPTQSLLTLGDAEDSQQSGRCAQCACGASGAPRRTKLWAPPAPPLRSAPRPMRPAPRASSLSGKNHHQSSPHLILDPRAQISRRFLSPMGTPTMHASYRADCTDCHHITSYSSVPHPTHLASHMSKFRCEFLSLCFTPRAHQAHRPRTGRSTLTATTLALIRAWSIIRRTGGNLFATAPCVPPPLPPPSRTPCGVRAEPYNFSPRNVRRRVRTL